jgi:hypothetical protein
LLREHPTQGVKEEPYHDDHGPGDAVKISELKVGRELDRLVAEKVMGWRCVKTTNKHGQSQRWLTDNEDALENYPAADGTEQ